MECVRHAAGRPPQRCRCSPVRMQGGSVHSPMNDTCGQRAHGGASGNCSTASLTPATSPPPSPGWGAACATSPPPPAGSGPGACGISSCGCSAVWLVSRCLHRSCTPFAAAAIPPAAPPAHLLQVAHHSFGQLQVKAVGGSAAAVCWQGRQGAGRITSEGAACHRALRACPLSPHAPLALAIRTFTATSVSRHLPKYTRPNEPWCRGSRRPCCCTSQVRWPASRLHPRLSHPAQTTPSPCQSA